MVSTQNAKKLTRTMAPTFRQVSPM